MLMAVTSGGCRARAALGALVWLTFVVAVLPGWAEALLLLAPLVVVPLGLALLLPPGHPPSTGWLRAAAVVQLPAALPLLGAMSRPAGPVAAVFALPWLTCTLLLALAGLRHGWPRSALQLCQAGTLLFPTVGGGWLVLSALGARPLNFAPEIVRATAIHFHYAGFALPLLAVLAARARPGALGRGVCVGVVAGVPLVALGITLSAFEVRLSEWLAAWFLAAVCAVLACHQLDLARRWRGRAGLLFAVSGLSLLVGMGLAALYAWGNYWGLAWLDIPLMVRTHGAVNALGFAVPGLLAWNLAGAVGSEGPCGPRTAPAVVEARV
jgi:hypothetical protein